MVQHAYRRDVFAAAFRHRIRVAREAATRGSPETAEFRDSPGSGPAPPFAERGENRTAAVDSRRFPNARISADAWMRLIRVPAFEQASPREMADAAFEIEIAQSPIFIAV